MSALKKKGSNMLISNKFTVAMSVVALSSIGGGLMSTVHADEVKQDTNVVQTAAVDTTSENAIAEKAKLVILGVDTDGKIIPHGEDRIAYLKTQNYDYQKVQDKVNELLAPAAQAAQAAPEAQAEATQDTNVDTTSESAITEKAKRVISGVDTDGTIIPHGEERIAYLKAQNYDYQKVQDKVNELLAAAVQAPAQAPVAQAPAAQAPAAQAPVAQVPAAQAPVAQAPVAQAPAAQAPVAQAPASTGTYTTRNGFTVNSAKEAVAMTESGGSYGATNGQYIGRYQLSAGYLNGDYSAENQERVADQYVAERYGSWEAAWAFHQAHGWY